MTAHAVGNPPTGMEISLRQSPTDLGRLTEVALLRSHRVAIPALPPADRRDPGAMQ